MMSEALNVVILPGLADRREIAITESVWWVVEHELF